MSAQVQADGSSEQLAAAGEAATQLVAAASLQKPSRQLPGQLLEAARVLEALQEAKAQLTDSCAESERQLAGETSKRLVNAASSTSYHIQDDFKACICRHSTAAIGICDCGLDGLAETG